MLVDTGQVSPHLNACEIFDKIACVRLFAFVGEGYIFYVLVDTCLFYDTYNHRISSLLTIEYTYIEA